MMAKISPLSAVDDAIARAERRLEGLRHIRELAQDDPDLLVDLVAELGVCRNGQQIRQPRKRGKLTHFQQIRTYFEGHSNAWRSAPQIIQDTGLTRGAVSHILYRAHKDAFDKRKKANNEKVKVWRLRKEVVY